MRITVRITGGHLQLDRLVVLDEDRLTARDHGEVVHDAAAPADVVRRAQQLARELPDTVASGDTSCFADAAVVEIHVADGTAERTAVFADGDDVSDGLLELVELLEGAGPAGI
jgi:hypothetical protein